MKRKICTLALVIPLIFTISFSQKKQTPVAGVESSIPATQVIKNVPVAANITLTADEKQMVALVNKARIQNKVPPLKVDMQVTNVARIKAQEMITKKYFSHTSPKYGSPFAMLKSFGVRYVAAGENIAGNSNVANAQSSLMKSPGHRKNILNPAYNYVGIGIKNGGPYGKMISQMFIKK